MAVIRPLTAADIDRLRDKATDRNGVNEIYQELNDRGYSSAAWARNEYDRGTAYGAANAVYFNNQNASGNIKMNDELADKLYRNTALRYLDALSDQLGEKSEVSRDATYDERRNARDLGSLDSDIDPRNNQSVLDPFMDIMKRRSGAQQQE